MLHQIYKYTLSSIQTRIDFDLIVKAMKERLPLMTTHNGITVYLCQSSVYVLNRKPYMFHMKAKSVVVIYVQIWRVSDQLESNVLVIPQ